MNAAPAQWHMLGLVERGKQSSDESVKMMLTY
jgi:hypothetical protein